MTLVSLHQCVGSKRTILEMATDVYSSKWCVLEHPRLVLPDIFGCMSLKRISNAFTMHMHFLNILTVL